MFLKGGTKQLNIYTFCAVALTPSFKIVTSLHFDAMNLLASLGNINAADAIVKTVTKNTSF